MFMHRNIRHLQDVAVGNTTLTDKQVQILSCLLIRATQLLLWMMDRPSRPPSDHPSKGERFGQGVLASETKGFLNDLSRVVSKGTLLGTPTIDPDWCIDKETPDPQEERGEA
jgi:hypothetical protein